MFNHIHHRYNLTCLLAPSVRVHTYFAANGRIIRSVIEHSNSSLTVSACNTLTYTNISNNLSSKS